MTHLLALVGVLGISFSAVFVRLASVSPVTATFYRAAYAVPLLLLIWMGQRSRDGRSMRDRALALSSGLVLAVDLNLWHESIGLIGAGLGTLVPNVQVVFVALAAWALHGERPTVGRIGTIALVATGVVLASGLARPDAYGANPVWGVVLGVLAGLCYAAYILIFRAANQTRAPRSGPLLDSTLGMLAGAILSVPLDRHFTLAVSGPAHMWLALLALISQVLGWMLIAGALPRLPAIETSILLLGQPVLAVIWGVLMFGERLSSVQWTGSLLVLAGVATLTVRGTRRPPLPRGDRFPPRRSYTPAT
ncbi:MAG: DMT family transporter [Vicinamibacterales bacterium]